MLIIQTALTSIPIHGKDEQTVLVEDYESKNDNKRPKLSPLLTLIKWPKTAENLDVPVPITTYGGVTPLWKK